MRIFKQQVSEKYYYFYVQDYILKDNCARWNGVCRMYPFTYLDKVSVNVLIQLYYY